MTKRYTAADFANAQFAKTLDGHGAMRMYAEEDGGLPWFTDDAVSCSSDQLARYGWVPVFPARTIHDRDVEALCTDKASYERDDYLDGFIRGFQQAGGVILDDPEPTNADRLEQLIRESGFSITYAGEHVDAREFAEHLNDDNVTAPNVKGN